MTHVQEMQKQGNDFSLFNYSQLHASNDCLIKVTNFVDYQKKKSLNLIVEVLITTAPGCHAGGREFNSGRTNTQGL